VEKVNFQDWRQGHDTSTSRFGISRRALLQSASALPLFAIGARRANAAEFTYKLATGQS
jgi:hypothetical protein